MDVYEYVVPFHMNDSISFRPTSQASHAGDSTTRTPKHDTGVGSGVWLGWFFYVTAVAIIAMAAASVGNSLALRRLESEVSVLRANVAAMQNTLQKSPQPRQSQ